MQLATFSIAARDPESGLPRVSAGFSLLTGDGTVVQRVPPAPIKPTAEAGMVALYSPVSIQINRYA